MFRWRVEERLGYEKIRDRLNTDLTAYPPPVNPKQPCAVWTVGAVTSILSNPKYTGYAVWNRRGPKGKPNPPSAWVWSAEPAHETLVSRELFEQAQHVGHGTERSRQGSEPNAHPLTKRTYLLRSFVHCSHCGRRMIGKERSGTVYYRCKTTHADRRALDRFPDHPRSVAVREDVVHEAVEGFFAGHMFGSDRAALLAQHFSEAESRAHAEHVQRAAGLEARIAAAEQAKRRLVREIETLPDDDELAQAMRADIRERYYQQEGERRALAKELDELKAHEPPPPEDPGLLDACP